MLLITGAALGDRFGRKRMFVIGLGIFTVASALAALATVFSAHGSYASSQGFSDGVVAALPIAAAVLAVGAVLALFVPGRPRRAVAAVAVPATAEAAV